MTESDEKPIGVPRCPGIREELLNDPEWASRIGDFLIIYDPLSYTGGACNLQSKEWVSFHPISVEAFLERIRRTISAAYGIPEGSASIN